LIVALTKWNWVWSEAIPLYLHYDFGDKNYRLKVFEETVVYVDDTATGTNRTGTGEVKLYDAYPFAIPLSLTRRSLTVEIYDANNAKRRTLTLDYYVGGPRIYVSYRDARTNTPIIGYTTVLCQIDPPLFTEAVDSYIEVPRSIPMLIEFRGLDAKYYDIRRITPTTHTAISVTQSDVYDVEIMARIDLDLMKRLFYETAVSPTVSQYAYSQLPNRPDIQYLLATRLLRELKITAPIKNAWLDSNYVLHIIVEQDIIPILKAIIIAMAVITGVISASYIASKYIDMRVKTSPTTINYKLIEYENERQKRVAELVENGCRGLAGKEFIECVERVTKAIGGENLTMLVVQAQENIEKAKEGKEKYKYLAIAAGAIAGLAIIARGGTTIIEKR